MVSEPRSTKGTTKAVGPFAHKATTTANRPYWAFRRPGSGLKSRPMTDRMSDLGFEKYGRPGLDLAKSNST
ncbi:hypothetical protein MTR_1g091033 [Medicago truncatula]|uniref:Uncharacterized protein n=1 Tax=Medicago truncatula TaxID=3880 RepID=A0A072VNM8_MEDTR|nr:hypothetical protein MTR_1g091033 [Medicago truncatula]